ncbi:MAG TPA: acyl-CoA thioesterase [Stellaceae bacterium]|nr:acyl-CoA thioesterase [Stellaceae bacterium]
MNSGPAPTDEKPGLPLLLQTIAMPADTNPAGDIFGGWLLSQMDLAGAVAARAQVGGRLATVAVESMKFHRPVLVGDLVASHGAVVRIGRTSIAVRVEIWVHRAEHSAPLKVTEGIYTYVAIDADRRPRVIGS